MIEKARFATQTGKKLLNHKETEQAQINAIPRLLELGWSVEQDATALSLPVEKVRRFVQER